VCSLPFTTPVPHCKLAAAGPHIIAFTESGVLGFNQEAPTAPPRQLYTCRQQSGGRYEVKVGGECGYGALTGPKGVGRGFACVACLVLRGHLPETYRFSVISVYLLG
jgi:hypothetical protein